jgi:hypothetical protein
VTAPLDAKLLNGLKLGLEGEHQYVNAGLSVALCSTWLNVNGHLEETLLKQIVSSGVKSSSFTAVPFVFIYCYYHSVDLTHLPA